MIFLKYYYEPKYKIGEFVNNLKIIGFVEGKCGKKACYKLQNKDTFRVTIYECKLFDERYAKWE